MFGTEFLQGQGLGNQLFCYVTARCVALDLGYEFGCANQMQFANNLHNDKGMYFLDIDLGKDIRVEDCKKYYEQEERIVLPNSFHDINYGCYVSGEDKTIATLQDNTLLYGNLQSEYYFLHHKQEIKEWLKVKPEFDSYEYSQDDLCIINFRGGEYVCNRELFLKQSYWEYAMQHMKKINPNMRFMIVTEDVETAVKTLPGIPAYHFDIAKDYVTIKNAKYLILSNSSFACFPAFTSETVKFIIAPKYWARYNVSNGYWASEQNIYSGWNYMDRKGQLYSAEACREELKKFKEKSFYFKDKNYIVQYVWKKYCWLLVEIKKYMGIIYKKILGAY